MVSKFNPLAFAKAVVGAVVPFVAVWSQTGTLDYKAIVAAAVGAAFVYAFPNAQRA